MPINSTEVSYGFGQMGSVYTTAGQDAITPPTNKVFVAITMLADTVFDTDTGLIASNDTTSGLEYIGNAEAAHNAGTATTSTGTAGLKVNSVTFPKGITIYGRWSEIDVSSGGGIVAYIGD